MQALKQSTSQTIDQDHDKTFDILKLLSLSWMIVETPQDFFTLVLRLLENFETPREFWDPLKLSRLVKAFETRQDFRDFLDQLKL
jgi:hypothetical protein